MKPKAKLETKVAKSSQKHRTGPDRDHSHTIPIPFILLVVKRLDECHGNACAAVVHV
jgi:hypothetical protein